MHMAYSSVAVEAAGRLQAWRTGGFAALRAHAERTSPAAGSLIDLERRELLNAILQKIDEIGDEHATGDLELPDVKVEACLNLLRHLGASQEY